MAVQDLEITVKAHVCHDRDEDGIRRLASKVRDVLVWDCNTITVTAHFDERGVNEQTPPVVINVALPTTYKAEEATYCCD